VQLDRQSIERRDFPIARRGYDPAAVDAHLRELAAQVEELRHLASSRAGGESLASSAGTQVQSILEAAEATAANIEQKAVQDTREMREQASHEAALTRDQALAQARAHVQSVSQVTAKLRQRIESMDQEVSALVERVGLGSDRLLGDLQSVEANMGELYEAAAGHTTPVSAAPPVPVAQIQEVPAFQPPTPIPDEVQEHFESEPVAETQPSVESSDLDGARLIALNMALNGDPREQTDRYLAENFQLADRRQLLDEVYAAIEG
jgi:DivIVA domain-containing protein